MPLLNDLLDFSENPLMPLPSAQLLLNTCPLSGSSTAFPFLPMPPLDAAAYPVIWSFGWWSAWRFSAMNLSPKLFVVSI